jgi:hypothetical protein
MGDLKESQPKPPRKSGYLFCKTCKRSIPYSGYSDPGLEPWPEHRCKGHEVKRFHRFCEKDPNAAPIPIVFPEQTR